MAREQINIRLTAFEKRRLQEVAQQNHQTLSDLLRQAVNEIVADCSDDSAILKLRKK